MQSMELEVKICFMVLSLQEDEKALFNRELMTCSLTIEPPSAHSILALNSLISQRVLPQQLSKYMLAAIWVMS